MSSADGCRRRKDGRLAVKMILPGRNDCAQASRPFEIVPVRGPDGAVKAEVDADANLVELNWIDRRRRQGGIAGGRERLFVVQERGNGNDLVGKIIEG